MKIRKNKLKEHVFFTFVISALLLDLPALSAPGGAPLEIAKPRVLLNPGGAPAAQDEYGNFFDGDKPGTAGVTPNQTPSQPTGERYQEPAAKEADRGNNNSNQKLDGVKKEDRLNNDKIKKEIQAGQSRVNKLKSLPQKTPAQQIEIKQDAALLDMAKELNKRQKILDAEHAQKAHDAELRKHLLAISEGQEKRQELKKEESRLTNQIAELTGLAAKMMQNSAGMGSMQTPGSGPSGIIGSANRDSSSVSSQPITEKEKSPGPAEDAKAKDELALTAAEKLPLANSKDPKAAALKAKDYSLKNALLANLAAGEKGANGMGSSGASSDSNSGVTKKQEAPAAQVTEDFLHAPVDQGGAPSGSRFSLNGSETDAAVKRIIDEEKSRNSASVDPIQADGVLETESPSLFERVKSHISACLRQRCVLSSSNAK